MDFWSDLCLRTIYRLCSGLVSLQQLFQQLHFCCTVPKPAMPPSSASERSQSSNEDNNVGAVAAWIESVRRSTSTHHKYLVLSAGILAGANSTWQRYLVFELNTILDFNTKVIASGTQDTLTQWDIPILKLGIWDLQTVWQEITALGSAIEFVKRMKAYTAFSVLDKYGVSVQCALFLGDHQYQHHLRRWLWWWLNGLFYGITSPLFFNWCVSQKEGLSRNKFLCECVRGGNCVSPYRHKFYMESSLRQLRSLWCKRGVSTSEKQGDSRDKN